MSKICCHIPFSLYFRFLRRLEVLHLSQLGRMLPILGNVLANTDNYRNEIAGLVRFTLEISESTSFPRVLTSNNVELWVSPRRRIHQHEPRLAGLCHKLKFIV